MMWIVALERSDGSDAGYLAISETVGFKRNPHIERAYQTDKQDAEDLAADFNDLFHMKGYGLTAKAVRFVKVEQVQ